MNSLVRRFRRWRYAKKCPDCSRRYMWVHGCRNFPKTLSAAQDELNATFNAHVDNGSLFDNHQIPKEKPNV
jgi:hypothetical protein